MGASKQTPLISVIIPVYNTQTTLQRCFDSIAAQSYANLEIILVDDGSTDTATMLCDALASQDSRVKVIHQPNQGLSVARNTGLQQAKGDYVTFVDSDDTIHSEMIATLYALTQKYQTKLSICSFSTVSPDGQHRAFARQIATDVTKATSVKNSKNPTDAVDTNNLASVVYSTSETLVHMLCEDGFTMSAWGKLYARELFRNVQFPAGKLYEDVGTTYRLVLQCPGVAFTPWSGYEYYQNPASIIHQEFRAQKLDLITLTDQMCDDIASSSIFRANNSQNGQNHQNNQDDQTRLTYALKKRRIHARFSILRQLTGNTPLELRLRRELASYIRAHADDILKNPLRTYRDVIATRAVQLSVPLFLTLWRIRQKV